MNLKRTESQKARNQFQKCPELEKNFKPKGLEALTKKPKNQKPRAKHLFFNKFSKVS